LKDNEFITKIVSYYQKKFDINVVDDDIDNFVDKLPPCLRYDIITPSSSVVRFGNSEKSAYIGIVVTPIYEQGTFQYTAFISWSDIHFISYGLSEAEIALKFEKIHETIEEKGLEYLTLETMNIIIDDLEARDSEELDIAMSFERILREYIPLSEDLELVESEVSDVEDVFHSLKSEINDKLSVTKEYENMKRLERELSDAKDAVEEKKKELRDDYNYHDHKINLKVKKRQRRILMNLRDDMYDFYSRKYKLPHDYVWMNLPKKLNDVKKEISYKKGL